MPFKMPSTTQGRKSTPRVSTEVKSDVAVIRTKVVELKEQLRLAEDYLRRAYLGTAFSSLPRVFDAIDASQKLCAHVEDTLSTAWTANQNTDAADRVAKRFELEKYRTEVEAIRANLFDLDSRAVEAKKVLTSKPSNFEMQSPTSVEDETVQLLPPPALTQEDRQTMKAARDGAFAEHRARKMVKIQGQVHEVNEFMRDLAQIVMEQGMQIQSVETNTFHCKAVIEEAKDEIREAAAKKSDSLGASLRLLLFVTGLVLVITLWYHHSFYHSPFRAARRSGIVHHRWPINN